MELKRKIQEIEYEYTLDRSELGKILFITSATLFLFSVHAVLTLNPVLEESEQTEQRLDQLGQVVQTERFNESLGALQDLRTAGIGEDMQYALRTFRGMRFTLQEQESSYDTLDKTVNTYQWLVLVGLLGMVAGASTIYL
jgi:hypothetical protein